MKKNTTKLDIANHLHESLGFNKTESKSVIKDFFNEILSSLNNNKDVKISGFGNFNLINKKGRPGRNPKTGESVRISARKVVTFRAGKKLRKKVFQYNGD